MRSTLAFKPIAICALALLVSWQIVTRTLVAYLVTASPDFARSLAPDDPQVLLALASDAADGLMRAHQASLNGAKSDSPLVDKGQLKRWAVAAIAAAPVNPTALRILGQLASAEGDDLSADALMTRAAHLSRQETPALLWLLSRAYNAGDVPSIIRYADALLSTRALSQPVAPVLASLAATTKGRAALQELLATNPRWRSEFFAALPNAVTDARLPLMLLTGLHDTSAPAKSADFQPYLRFLENRKLYELAYYAWLQSLDESQLARAGMLYNGGFDHASIGGPFDWTLNTGTGVLAEMTPGPDVVGKQALRIEFTVGRVEFGNVSQMILLAPGAYTLTGKFRGELNGRRPLEWQIACVGSEGDPIGHQAFLGTERLWQDFSASFKVPAENCRAQTVRLVHAARSSSEQFITGIAWFDDLKITAVTAE